MESTMSMSASKGVFLISKGLKKSKKRCHVSKKKHDTEALYKKQSWYKAFMKNWECTENKIKKLQQQTSSMLLDQIVHYIKSVYEENDTVQLDKLIPSITLLTGISQHDHASHFTTLIDKMGEEVTPHTALIHSQDAPSLKHLLQTVISQLINGCETLDIYDEEDSDDATTPRKGKSKKIYSNMKSLLEWYSAMYNTDKIKQEPKRPLVIILSDFERFDCKVLQSFVLILSSYMCSLPIVLVFGVATSVSALHNTFPCHVSSKLLIRVFPLHSSPVNLIQTLEEVFLTHTNPFQLSEKAFKLITDVFLFYDFSVTTLVQCIKYCMIDHYYGDNIKSLCCDRSELYDAIEQLNAEDLENIRRLMSFRKFLEQQRSEIKYALFTDDNYFKDILYQEMDGLHEYLYNFYLCVRLLLVLVKDLPNNKLGRTVREIYAKCTAQCITETQEFEQCMLLINFQSGKKLAESIENALKIVKLMGTPSKNVEHKMDLDNNNTEPFISNMELALYTFLKYIKSSNTKATNYVETDNAIENVFTNRYEFNEKLRNPLKVLRTPTEFEMVRSRFVDYLKKMFTIGLQPPHEQPFHEIMFFTNATSVKNQIVSSPRGAMHTALSNPVHYLQCSCCCLRSPESVTNTLPDVCVAYKLHLECGKHINLHDWFQAFTAVLKPNSEDDETQLDSNMQKRFTAAVGVLKFSGFIKSSQRKTDHVLRVNW